MPGIQLFQTCTTIMPMSTYSQVPRVEKLSPTQFITEYGLPGKPVVIEGCMKTWKAFTSWTPAFFADNYGTVEVTVRQCGNNPNSCRMKLGDYLTYMANTHDGAPYYLSGWKFEFDIPELMDDYLPPEYFHSWHTRLPPELRPCWRWLFIGGANTGTRMHLDVMMTSAWNGVISGRKRWLLYSPDQQERVYKGRVDAFNPDFDRYPLLRDARPLECIQEPGDILFTPSGWWHQVVNEMPCISITENFINETNYRDVMKYLADSSQSIKRQLNLPRDFDLQQFMQQHLLQMDPSAEP